MDLSAHIGDLITVATEMRNAPGMDKKWLNKTISRLEDAQVFATLAIEQRQGSERYSFDPNSTADCNCVPGAVSATCPIHNKK